MDGRRQWSELSRRQRTAIVAGAAAEVALTGIALIDLARRPAAQVRGRKPVWALACFVQPVGSLAYLAFGRRSR